MAIEWAAQISEEAASWASHLGTACVWGGALSLAAWLLCRPRLRLPAATRAWLWWLVCFKMVFDLCGFPPLILPLLPASIVAAAPHRTPAPTPALHNPLRAASVPFSPVSASAQLSEFPAQSLHLPPSLSLWSGLQMLWSLGIFLSLVRFARQAAQLRRIRKQALPLSSPALQATANRLAATLGLRHIPALRQSKSVGTPCVTGALRPLILLPLGIEETLSADEIRLALAHELAHLRRGDIPLAHLPALMRTLFFFFPCAWLAASEWANAREEACDALALRVTGESATRYGGLLLKIISLGHSSRPTAALGMASAYPALKRRLVSLKAARGRSMRLARFLPALLVPLLVPWRLTAVSQPLTTLTSPVITRYEVRDLGTWGSSSAEAVSLNDSGQVVGNVRPVPGSQHSHGFFWSDGKMVPLTRQWNSLASGINNSGQIILSAYGTPGRPRALVWDGARHRLGSLPGYPYTQALAINTAGQVAGEAQTGGRDRWRALIAHAFLWDTRRMTDLGTLGGPYSSAYGINDSGTVVGKADTTNFGETHAFAWSHGEMSDLGTFGGANSIAYHVNNAGQAVGSAETGDGDTRHAFLWTDGVLRDLGVLPGAMHSAAYDINGAGQIVGASDTHAFLWQNGRMIDLNTLLPAHSGWVLETAKAINTQGQIAGSGLIRGHLHAFLLTPAG